jgi:glycerophosphoryl diester phosphodiesterase
LLFHLIIAMRNTATNLLNKTDRNNLFMIIDSEQTGKVINQKGSMLDIAPTILPYIGYNLKFALGRNLQGKEKTLVEESDDINKQLALWRPELQKLWGFPKINNADKILITSKLNKVKIGQRIFNYPLLVEFDKNNQTTFYFQFDNSKGHKKLSDHFDDIDEGKAFLWVGNCKDISSNIQFSKSACLKYGLKNVSSYLKPIKSNITVSLDKIKGAPPLTIPTSLLKKRYSTDRFIAHAGGKIDGRTYTNSFEALNKSYKDGFRLLELDIIKTADDFYVAAHDWKHWKKITDYQGNIPPTKAVFKQSKIYGKYTPLDMDDINQWFKQHSDAILVTDKINTPKDFSKIFLDKDRLMMELFTLKAVKEGLRAGIRSAMPSWSVIAKLPETKNNIPQYLQQMGVTDIAASRRIINSQLSLLTALRKNNIKVYAFHVNFDKNKDEKYVLCHDMDYIYGLYADKFNFEAKIDCNDFRDFPLNKLRDIHENRLPMQEFFLKIRWF